MRFLQIYCPFYSITLQLRDKWNIWKRFLTIVAYLSNMLYNLCKKIVYESKVCMAPCDTMNQQIEDSVISVSKQVNVEWTVQGRDSCRSFGVSSVQHRTVR